MCGEHKKLCDCKKMLKKDLGAYIRLVDEPAFICRKCGRVANDEKNLCKSRELY